MLELCMISNLQTTEELLLKIGLKFKQVRLAQGLKRSSLAKLSNVSESSIKRFETIGEISLSSFLKISHVLSQSQWIDQILSAEILTSLSQLDLQTNQLKNKRGRK
jgi:transcriptional regulator with XRE-family HTH domain